MKRFCTSLLRGVVVPCLLIATFASQAARAETNPRFYAVEVSATVQAAPAQINLRWTADANATGYAIYRKAPSATSWSPITSLSGSATTWSDQNVVNGGTFEYAITKNTTLGYQGTGYIMAGINAPMTENRGKMILIVDNTHATALATELTRLQQDLVGDGWTVIRHDVARTMTPPQVKQLIQNAYNADPANVKSVFLFGHVAVPYSGNYNPDGHPDHQGAWAADTYYGDMDGSWTDSTVNNTGAEKEWNRNSPGDGKFDQSDLPSDVELAVGRVDLYNMTCFSNKAWSRSELDLLRAYLNKDHNFRHGNMSVPRRGLVCDNFGETEGEAFASTGWRSFAPFFGAENNVQVPYGQYFSTLRDNAYLWSYGTGGGSWYTCNGIGGSDDFATTEIKTVFTAFLGSYFGDWDNESAFLRAPLGSGWALASAWGGRPHWFFHPMGLGETLGTAAKLSQNNRYGGLYAGQNWGTHQVHVTLLGDPSLRMHPVIPPSSVTATAGTGVAITWAASTDTGIQGYNVYRGSSANGPFTKITGTSPVPSLFFTDTAGTANSFYMVRAVKLEQSGSGTYLNLSQGIILTPGSGTPTPTPTAPVAPSNLSGTVQSSTQVNLHWTDNSTNESGFRILRKVGASGAYTTLNIGANTTTYNDTGLTPSTQYYYKVHAWNSVGDSADSAEISVTTQTAPTPIPATNSATFVKIDTTTRGSWKGIYGSQGGRDASYSIVPQNPALTLSATYNYQLFWAASTADTRALQKASGTDRVAAAWHYSIFMDFNLRFSDTAPHRVSFYFLDWDNAGRQQRVDFLDLTTGQLLYSTTITNFSNGIYSTWDLKGSVRVRITRLAGPDAVLSAFFVDPATTPTPPPSGAANAVRFLGANTTTSGTWKGTFGTQGAQIAAEGTGLPSYANVTFAGKTDHVWNWNTSDTAALQKISASDRVASCWYSASSFDIRVNVTDGQTHKVSFYALDWDMANRTASVQVLDGATGAVLHTMSLTSFTRGTWLSYDLKGSLTFRFTRTAGANAVISGLFFDAPSAAL